MSRRRFCPRTPRRRERQAESIRSPAHDPGRRPKQADPYVALDLVGPEPDDPQIAEILNVPPSRWYLTGFLVPWAASVHQKRDEDDTQGELGFGEAATAADDDEKGDEPPAARRGQFLSST